MATTSIWPISGNIQAVINYVANPEKTENKDFNNPDIQSLKDVMDYAVNPTKTEQQQFVSGINCEPSIARKQMLITKERFGKTDGRTAYHAYQSFKPGETDPQTAHQIGIEFAQQLWGDRFQVVVATHVDKVHVHNHFVINSVSFLDGKKFHSSCESYFGQMRQLSDELCQKHHLSVIEKPAADGRASKTHKEWQDEKDGKPTWRGLVRQEIDQALAQATVWSQFIASLTEKGYVVKTNVKYIAVKPPGKERFIRLRSLGDQYTEEALKQKLLSQQQTNTSKITVQDKLKNRPVPESAVQKRRSRAYVQAYPNSLAYSHSRIRNRRKGYRKLYLRFMLQMGIIRPPDKSDRRVHFLFREEIRHVDKIMAGFHLIRSKHLDTYADLITYQKSIKEQITELLAERKNLYSQKRKLPATADSAAIQQQLDQIRNKLRQERKDLRTCEDIKIRSLAMAEKLGQVNQERIAQKKQQAKEMNDYAKQR